MTNLVADLRDEVEAHADRTAIVFRETELSYGQLWARVGQFAAGLRDRGFGEGDRVAVYLPNLPQFVTAFHGTLLAGGIVVPMNPQYRAREIEHLLDDSDATVVVTLPDLVGEVERAREGTDLEHVVTVGEAPDETDAVRFEAFLGDGDPAVVDRADDDVAVQPYTSGTTGRPKGVLLTHENLRSNVEATTDLLPGGFQADDKQLGVLPLFHIYGMTVVMEGTLFHGGTYYPMPEWDARRAVSLIEDAAITVMNGVPAMYLDIVNQPDAESFDLSSLRFANAGGSALPQEVAHTFEELYGVELYEGYGLTETSPITHANRPGERRAGSIGKPIAGVDAKIVDRDFEEVPPVDRGPVDAESVAPEERRDEGSAERSSADSRVARDSESPSNRASGSKSREQTAAPRDDGETAETVDLDEISGEIVVSGPNVMKGYHGLPEASEAAFTEVDGTRWFHTGDVGYRDEDGYFFVIDRQKDVIVTGGYNVYPREVEELLFEHEAVADAAVVGIPDERRGETVKAFVVPASVARGRSSEEHGESDGVPVPDADVTEDEIQQYCLDNLAAYKHPREVEFVEDLPRTTTGKVQKYELRERETADVEAAE